MKKHEKILLGLIALCACAAISFYLTIYACVHYDTRVPLIPSTLLLLAPLMTVFFHACVPPDDADVPSFLADPGSLEQRNCLDLQYFVIGALVFGAFASTVVAAHGGIISVRALWFSNFASLFMGIVAMMTILFIKKT